MVKYQSFLRWWFFFVLILLSSIACYALGGYHYMFGNDSTNITAAIFTVFYLTTLWVGVKTFGLSKRIASCNKLHKNDISKFDRQEQIINFISISLTSCGFVGTIVGLLMAIRSFGNIEAVDTEVVHKLLGELGQGLSVAMITTLSGLVCSMLLNIQGLNFSLELQKKCETE